MFTLSEIFSYGQSVKIILDQVGTDTVMNVTQCSTGMLTELNDKAQCEQSSSGSNLNGLPVDLHGNTGSRLSHSGVYHLKLDCSQKNCESIVNKTIKEAKDNHCYEFPKMEKYNMNQEDIDNLNKNLAQGKFPCFDHQIFAISNKGCVIENIGRPKYRNFFSRFEFGHFDPIRKLVHNRSGLYIYTGELENGLVFLKLPRLAMKGSFMHYSHEFNRIVWLGDTNPTVGLRDLSFYSFCVGESFEKVLETFKKINCCKLLACLVEDMLQKKDISGLRQI